MARRLPSWWKRLSRPSILEEDAGIQNTTTNNELDVLEEAQKAVLEQQIVDDGQGNNAWLFAAEKEAPCCLNCGKRFSVVITRLFMVDCLPVFLKCFLLLLFCWHSFTLTIEVLLINWFS